ncbi:MAG: hypothetical protein ABEH78_01075 [Haloferacaceae archaeon]
MAVDRERLADRLAAVERRLTDADPDEGGLGDVAAVEGRLAELEARADDLDERLGEVESGLQALRGYVGGVDAVDESVERRADAALAKAEELEARLDDDPDLTVERVPTDSGCADDGGSGEAGIDGLSGELRADDGRNDRRPDGPSDGWDRWEGEPLADDGPRESGSVDGSIDGLGAAPGGEGGETDGDAEGDERRFVDRLRDAL